MLSPLGRVVILAPSAGSARHASTHFSDPDSRFVWGGGGDSRRSSGGAGGGAKGDRFPLHTGRVIKG
eukprot:1655608-Pyramimonas_sp.AAC.1